MSTSKYTLALRIYLIFILTFSTLTLAWGAIAPGLDLGVILERILVDTTVSTDGMVKNADKVDGLHASDIIAAAGGGGGGSGIIANTYPLLLKNGISEDYCFLNAHLISTSTGWYNSSLPMDQYYRIPDGLNYGYFSATVPSNYVSLRDTYPFIIIPAINYTEIYTYNNELYYALPNANDVYKYSTTSKTWGKIATMTGKLNQLDIGAYGWDDEAGIYKEDIGRFILIKTNNIFYIYDKSNYTIRDVRIAGGTASGFTRSYIPPISTGSTIFTIGNPTSSTNFVQRIDMTTLSGTSWSGTAIGSASLALPYNGDTGIRYFGFQGGQPTLVYQTGSFPPLGPYRMMRYSGTGSNWSEVTAFRTGYPSGGYIPFMFGDVIMALTGGQDTFNNYYSWKGTNVSYRWNGSSWTMINQDAPLVYYDDYNLRVANKNGAYFLGHYYPSGQWEFPIYKFNPTTSLFSRFSYGDLSDFGFLSRSVPQVVPRYGRNTYPIYNGVGLYMQAYGSFYMNWFPDCSTGQ